MESLEITTAVQCTLRILILFVVTEAYMLGSLEITGAVQLRQLNSFCTVCFFQPPYHTALAEQV